MWIIMAILLVAAAGLLFLLNRLKNRQKQLERRLLEIQQQQETLYQLAARICLYGQLAEEKTENTLLKEPLSVIVQDSQELLRCLENGVE